MQLFKFTKILFERPGDWLDITKGEKRKQYYMTSQFMSIVFPLQAQVLNHIKISQESAMDFWQKFIRQRYKRVPFWMYIKGKVKRKEGKEKKTISNALILDYCKAYTMDPKTIKDALLHFPDEIIKEIKKFDKIRKQ